MTLEAIQQAADNLTTARHVLRGFVFGYFIKRHQVCRGITGRPLMNIPVKNVYDALRASSTVKAAAEKLSVSPAYVNSRVPNPHKYLKEGEAHGS